MTVGCRGKECAYKVWVGLGDALLAKNHYLSAVEKYKKALSVLGSRGTSAQVAEIRGKIARCFLKRGDKKAALRCLEAIEDGYYTVESELMLGKLYLDAGVVKAAHACFWNVIRRAPLALEAALYLVESNAGSIPEVVELIKEAAMSTQIHPDVLKSIESFLVGK